MSENVTLLHFLTPYQFFLISLRTFGSMLSEGCKMLYSRSELNIQN